MTNLEDRWFWFDNWRHKKQWPRSDWLKTLRKILDEFIWHSFENRFVRKYEDIVGRSSSINKLSDLEKYLFCFRRHCSPAQLWLDTKWCGALMVIWTRWSCQMECTAGRCLRKVSFLTINLFLSISVVLSNYGCLSETIDGFAASYCFLFKVV